MFGRCLSAATFVGPVATVLPNTNLNQLRLDGGQIPAIRMYGIPRSEFVTQRTSKPTVGNLINKQELTDPIHTKMAAMT